MSVLQYPQYQYFIIAAIGGANLGRFKSVDGLLGLAQIRMYIKNPNPYSHQARLVFSSQQGGTAIVTSDWETISNATTGQTGTDWLGDIVFDIDHYRLNPLADLHVRLQLTGYTRPDYPNQDDRYIGVWCDWTEPVGIANTAGARLSMGVYL